MLAAYSLQSVLLEPVGALPVVAPADNEKRPCFATVAFGDVERVDGLVRTEYDRSRC